MRDIITAVYLFLLLCGVIQVVWLMALIAHDRFLCSEPKLIRQGRRVALMFFALGLLCAAEYYVANGITPQWPDILVIASIDLYMALAIAAANLRLRTMVTSSSPCQNT